MRASAARVLLAAGIMRTVLALCFGALLLAGCSSDDSVDERNNMIVSGLYEHFEVGTWTGKTAAGSRCEARVSHGTQGPREFTLEVSSEGSPVATFYANAGETLNIVGRVGRDTDLKVDAGGTEPHSWELRAEKNFDDELQFIEVKESGGGESLFQRCSDLTKT